MISGNPFYQQHTQYLITSSKTYKTIKLAFYNNKFDPSCCNIPHIYTTSTGCACLSLDQFNFLNQRGGNNTENHGNI